jgi:hypothetical protein
LQKGLLPPKLTWRGITSPEADFKRDYFPSRLLQKGLVPLKIASEEITLPRDYFL